MDKEYEELKRRFILHRTMRQQRLSGVVKILIVLILLIVLIVVAI